MNIQILLKNNNKIFFLIYPQTRFVSYKKKVKTKFFIKLIKSIHKYLLVMSLKT